jgi:hypothetical protein
MQNRNEEPIPVTPDNAIQDVSDKHVYEVEPRQGDRRGLMIQASAGKRPEALERSAIGYAETLLAENPELTGVGIYHTYPKAGPVRRYVREVKQSVEA